MKKAITKFHIVTSLSWSAFFAAPFAAFAGLPHAFNYGGKAFADVPAVERGVQDTDGRRKSVYEWTSTDGKLLLRTTETVYKNLHQFRFMCICSKTVTG